MCLSPLNVGKFVFVLLAVLCAGCGQKTEPPKPAPPQVTVTQPVQMTVPEIHEYVGQIDSPQTVELRARVPGFLKSIEFSEGAFVKQGTLLFVIDPSQYEIALQQVQAQLEVSKVTLLKAQQVESVSVAEAALEHAKAASVNAAQKQKDFEVAFQGGAASRELLDDAITAAKQAVASVTSAEATLAQARADYETNIAGAQASITAAAAAVAKAKLDLGYTKVLAPIDGRIGRATVKIGSLVGQGEPTLLATMSQTDPMYVYFSVSEREALANRKLMDSRRFGLPDGTMPVQLYIESGDRYEYDGRINFVERILDPGTGTLTVRAEFPDPEKRLRPGNYAKLKIPITVRENALIVSERAIGTDQGGKFLLIVGQNNIVEQRPVRAGQRFNGMVIIEDGLKPGERYVVNGLLRARPGAPVTPAEQPPPANIVIPEFTSGKAPAGPPLAPIAPDYDAFKKKE